MRTSGSSHVRPAAASSSSFFTEVPSPSRAHTSDAHAESPLSKPSYAASTPSSSTAHTFSVSPDSPHADSGQRQRQRRSWQVRLWNFLFPGEEAAGVEGATIHYGHCGPSAAHLDNLFQGDVHHTRSAVEGGARLGSVTEPVLGMVRTEVMDAMEPWHYMQVPLSRVLLFLRLQQRLADLVHQACWYAPFYVLLILFVLVGPVRHVTQATLDFVAVRRDAMAQPSTASVQTEVVLREAFRLDTEENVTAAAPDIDSAFVSGNSARAPWVYSWYNGSVNAWTQPPDRTAAVDAQLRRVAATYHEPIFVSLSSVRTRRDLLRWLQLQLVPRMWDCENPLFARSWRSTVTGARYRLGALRLISRRYRQHDSREVYNVRHNITTTAAQAISAGDREQAAKATPLLASARAAPPSIPLSLCGSANAPVSAAAAEAGAVLDKPTFSYDEEAGGYVALLPFSKSCGDTQALLEVMATPMQRVLWPPSFNTSLELREAWMAYTETDRRTNGTAVDSTASCASFLFDPAVSEVALQYVDYGATTNLYTVVDITFHMASSGAVVRPVMHAYTLGSLRWSYTFTSLALSITLGLTILLYGHYLVRRMLAQYAAKVSRISRPRRTRAHQLWCALMVLLHTQNLMHFLALVFAAASIAFWWQLLVELTGISSALFYERDVYPVAVDHAVRRGGLMLPRLCACAVFFATVGLVRFVSVTPGLWVCVQTFVRSVPRLNLIFCVWLLVNVGVAMACVLMYGSVYYEFRNFSKAFTMLIFMLLDSGRSLINGFTVQQQTGHYSIFAQDNSLPGIRGSRLGRMNPVPLDLRSATLSTINQSFNAAFLLFFFYFQAIVLIIWGMLTIMEAYRNVLLLPEAAALPLWRGMWASQFSSLTHVMRRDFWKEIVRRLLLARSEAVMLTDMEYHLRLAYARAPAGTTAAPAHFGQPPRSLQLSPAGETAVSLTMVLWLLPRELQLEYGAAHLRRLWYVCVSCAVAAQRSEAPWRSLQWRQHWEQQPSSLSGWLRASLPEDNTVEAQAARVAMRLEELPNSIVRYVEGKFM